MSSDIWRYAYVRRPYHDVVRLLAQAGERLLGVEESSTVGVAHLGATLAGVEVSKAVRLGVWRLRVEGESASLPLRWEAAEHPGLFPTMEATLEVAPLVEGHQQLTQLGLVGRYRPPFGVAGQAGDALFGRDVAEESVEGFLDRLVWRLESELPPVPAVVAARPTPPPSQRRKVHIVLPDLRRRRGGLLALERRLSSAPDVTLIRLHPGLAEVAYDPDLVTIGAILASVEEDGSEAVTKTH
jgi:hypothetical protein